MATANFKFGIIGIMVYLLSMIQAQASDKIFNVTWPNWRKKTLGTKLLNATQSPQ